MVRAGGAIIAPRQGGSELVMLVGVVGVVLGATSLYGESRALLSPPQSGKKKKTLHDKKHTQLYALARRQPKALAHSFTCSIVSPPSKRASQVCAMPRNSSLAFSGLAIRQFERVVASAPSRCHTHDVRCTTSYSSAQVSAHFSGPEARRRQ